MTSGEMHEATLTEMERQATTAQRRVSAIEKLVVQLVDALAATAAWTAPDGACWCFRPEIEAGYTHGHICAARRAVIRDAGIR